MVEERPFMVARGILMECALALAVKRIDSDEPMRVVRSRFASLRAGLRREEGILSFLTQHLFLIPASRDSETCRTTTGYYQPSLAGLEQF